MDDARLYRLTGECANCGVELPNDEPCSVFTEEYEGHPVAHEEGYITKAGAVPPWMERGWYDPHNDMIVWETSRRSIDLEDGEDEYPVVWRLVDASGEWVDV